MVEHTAGVNVVTPSEAMHKLRSVRPFTIKPRTADGVVSINNEFGQPIVVVTGASGFIGQHVCAALWEAGWNVRPVVRNQQPTTLRGAWLIRDMEEACAFDAALAGATALVHLAGLAHVLHEQDAPQEFQASNVRLTEVVIRAAATHRIQTVVFMSSAAVSMAYDRNSVGDRSMYAETKQRAEEVVSRIGADNGIHTWILRPPLVYGPGMKGNPLRLFKLIARAIPLPLGRIHNKRSFLYVKNLAAAVVAALECPERGGTYHITDWPAMSTEEFVHRVADALGVRLRLFAVPSGALNAIGMIGDTLRLIGVRVPSSSDIRRLTSSYELDGEVFRLATGYKPSVSLSDALEETAIWFTGSAGDAIGSG